jgi:hypothetical protein
VKLGVSHCSGVALIICLAFSIGGCKDNPLVYEEPVVAADRIEVYLAPGTSTVVHVTGGRAPYKITDGPDVTVVSASLVDTMQNSVNLSISAPASVAIGRITHVIVGDADEIGGGVTGDQPAPKEPHAIEKVQHGPNSVTIQIFIADVVTLSNDVQPIFTGKCATPMCHTGTSAPNGLVLDSGQSYGELVNVPAHATSCNGAPLVSPGNAAGSVLYERIVGTSCGPRMPYSLVGTDSLTSGEQSAIRIWIDQGALNN